MRVFRAGLALLLSAVVMSSAAWGQQPNAKPAVAQAKPGDVPAVPEDPKNFPDAFNRTTAEYGKVLGLLNEEIRHAQDVLRRNPAPTLICTQRMRNTVRARSGYFGTIRNINPVMQKKDENDKDKEKKVDLSVPPTTTRVDR